VDAVDAGERQLKGFSRPLPTFAVAGMRVGEAK
jgi:class 3 adenylate cyclase